MGAGWGEGALEEEPAGPHNEGQSRAGEKWPGLCLVPGGEDWAQRRSLKAFEQGLGMDTTCQAGS